MSMIFCDSWDHYNVILNKWSAAGTDTSIDLTGTKSRTGIGCLLIKSAAFGPNVLFTQRTNLIVGTAFFSDSAGEIMRLNFAATGAQNIRVKLLGDGSIQVLTGNDGGIAVTILGTSAAALYTFSAYNYIEVKVFIAASPNGSVVVRLNGAVILNITGVRTFAQPIDSGQPFVTQVQLMGPGGIPDCRHDDTYITDWSDGSTFFGAVRIYAQVPFEDGAPTDWTPSTGVDNFAMVDEIPPNDDTDYVTSDTVGTVDQYEYNTVGVPPASQIMAVQHVLDMRLDAAGSRSVASDVNGAVNATSFALTNSYKMYHTPYDTNPGTGVQFQEADFPAAFGPVVTA